MVCPPRLASSLGALVAAAALATSLTAQCGLDWSPGPAANGPHGTVAAFLVLPNGDVVAGGSFTVADSAIVNNVARWDGTTWHAFGAGIDGPVNALARLPNGHIVAGGSFTTAGGQPASCIARWNGTSWAPLGTGLDSTVKALLALPNGNLIAGGAFRHAGATTTNLVAQWDGVSWSPLGIGFSNYEVRSLARMQNGDVVVGGDLVEGTTWYGLQRWDGVSWQVVPGLDPFSTVDHVAVRPNGDLVATGTMIISSSFIGVVLWNGVTMQSLDPGVGSPKALIASANGDVWIGILGSQLAPSLRRWNGTGWTSVTGGPLRVNALAEDSSGRLLVGAAPTPTIERAVARFDGVNWQTIGAPTPPVVRAMVRMPNGDVVVGGSFASFGGVAANNVVRWNGSVWSPLGLGVDAYVSALAAAANGDLVASGGFTNAGGAPANHIARWNGQAWSTLGSGLPQEALDLAAGANGEVLATRGAGVNRFNGLTWSPLAIPGVVVLALASLPNGSFALGGVFTVTGTGVLIANGPTITPLPGAPTTILNLLADSRGGLVASGGTQLQRWDGTTWTTLPSLWLTSLGELPNGELIATGSFQSVGGAAGSCAFRLGSNGWESFGEVRGTTGLSVAASGHGDVFVAGSLESAGNLVSVGFAHAAPTCPAAASVVGAGCTGGAGPVTLVANNTPWAGGVFTATASGMTASSLAVQVFGSAAPALPLPGGAPGCSLIVAPLVMELLLPSFGIATSTWALPASPSLAGLQVRLQVVGIELGATGIVRLTSTNGLQLTIGAL